MRSQVHANAGPILIVIGLIFSTIGAAIVKSIATSAGNNFTGIDATVAGYLPTFMLLGGLALAGAGALMTYQGR
jgi:hypothetical protein